MAIPKRLHPKREGRKSHLCAFFSHLELLLVCVYLLESEANKALGTQGALVVTMSSPVAGAHIGH